MSLQKGRVTAFKPKRYQKKLHNEEKCYECGCGGEVIECDECPKCFHLQCLSNVDVVPEGLFSCPWHRCNCKLKTETTLKAGYFCAHCPISYCSDCVATGKINQDDLTTISSPPAQEVFSDLRRNGFTLQNKDSLLFVCSKCAANTDAAVHVLQTSKIINRNDGIIDSKSIKVSLVHLFAAGSIITVGVFN